MLIVQLHCCQCVSNLDINLGIAYYMLLCVHAQNVFCQKESADIASLSFDLLSLRPKWLDWYKVPYVFKVKH